MSGAPAPGPCARNEAVNEEASVPLARPAARDGCDTVLAGSPLIG